MALSACPADEAAVPPFIAADATGSNLITWAILAAVLWVAWYLVVCAAFPWRVCRWCDGGKKRSLSRRHWRDCHHCAGTGKRARFGRRLWAAVAGRDRSR